MSDLLTYFLPVALAGYLIGSIPFGLLLTKLAGYGDIRQIGSGNIGATNVLRTGNKALAALTLILDIGKGVLAVMLAKWILTFDAAMIAGCGAFLGHVFPVWLRFQGGKGVATALGILTALLPMLGALCALIWLAVAFAFRFSSLSSLTALGLSPVLAWYLTKDFSAEQMLEDGSTVFLFNHHLDALPYVCGFVAAIVFWKHRENIRRLLKGEEPKIGRKK